MSRLEIVWRNPNAGHRKRRWHEMARDVSRNLYLVEEWLTRGDQHCWAQTGALEIVYGGRAVAERENFLPSGRRLWRAVRARTRPRRVSPRPS